MEENELGILFKEFKAWAERKGSGFKLAFIVFFTDKSGGVFRTNGTQPSIRFHTTDELIQKFQNNVDEEQVLLFHERANNDE